MAHQTEFKRQSIEATKAGARPGYRTNFYDQQGVRRTVSLGTRDETEAKTICLGLELLANDITTVGANPKNARFTTIHRRAKVLWFGVEDVDDEPLTTVVTDKPLATGKAGFTAPVGRRWKVEKNEQANAEKKGRIDAERQVRLLQREKEQWEKTRADYERRLNLHCKATLEDALDVFEDAYKKDHVPHTVTQVMRMNREVGALIGTDKALGSIDGDKINQYLKELQGAARTRQKARAYISSFWSWAVLEYKLSFNPLTHVHSISVKPNEDIRCVKDWKTFEEYLEAFERWPYWRAWVAFAVLAGPRWAEQARLKVKDVTGDCDEVVIRASKTGRQRSVPIERSKLRPILQAWIKGKDADAPLFPYEYGKEGHYEHASTWHKGFFGWPLRKVKGIQPLLEKSGEPWDFGPAEWRHCAGTAWGQAGLDTLRISRWLGNSEAVCRQHYVKSPGATKWPLRWEDEPDDKPKRKGKRK